MRPEPAPLTIAVLTLASAATAGMAQPASCDAAVARLRQDATLGARIAGAAPEARQHLRSLMHAADGLRAAGYDAVCRDVVGAVEDMARRGAVGRADPGAGRRSDDDAWSMFGDWTGPDYADRAKAAVPFGPMAGRVASQSIVGADARLPDGEDVGAVAGFLTDDGQGVTDLIVGYGGFLNVGDREVAVPVDRVRYDVPNEVFYIHATHAWFDVQPDWDRASWLAEQERWVKDDR